MWIWFCLVDFSSINTIVAFLQYYFCLVDRQCSVIFAEGYCFVTTQFAKFTNIYVILEKNLN